MTIEETLAQVLATLRELSNGVPLEADDNLGEVEELDSLAFEEVLARFEDYFGVDLPVEKITEENMSTPRRMAQTLHAFGDDR